MNIARILLMLIAIYGTATAQVKKAGTDDLSVWHKNVMRTIDIADTAIAYDPARTAQVPDTSLAGVLTGMVLNGKLQTYDINYDNYELKDSTDPHMRERLNEYTTYPFFSYYMVHRYVVLEEWTYDAAHVRTHIRAFAIAPKIDVYSNDGIYRGSPTMYWLRYADAIKVISAYEKKHNDYRLTRGIWNSYGEEIK